MCASIGIIHDAQVNYYDFYPAGPPQFFTCEFQCPDVYLSGTTDRCTIIWERLPTVSCSLLQFNVSVTGPDGTPAYSGIFGQSTTSTETAPLNPNTTYTVTITAENVCGTTTCSATNSTAAERDGKKYSLLSIMFQHSLPQLLKTDPPLKISPCTPLFCCKGCFFSLVPRLSPHPDEK